MMTGGVSGLVRRSCLTHPGVKHARLASVLSHDMKALMILRSSAVLEVLTGTALILVPGAVVTALIGGSSTPVEDVLARVLGGALLALGVTGMLALGSRAGRPAALGFATYDAVAVLVLASAGVAGDANGWWLWPVVVLHGTLAIVLIAVWAGPSRRLRAAS